MARFEFTFRKKPRMDSCCVSCGIDVTMIMFVKQILRALNVDKVVVFKNNKLFSTSTLHHECHIRSYHRNLQLLLDAVF